MATLSTREMFSVKRNDCQELVFKCRICGLEFVEHDGDMITQRELSDHLEETHE